MLLIIVNLGLVICCFGLALTSSAVGGLIFFVAIFALAAAQFMLSSQVFVGLGYIVVYAGAIAVLFVFVVLLVDSQRLNLAQSRNTWLYNNYLALSVIIALAMAETYAKNSYPCSLLSEHALEALHSPSFIGLSAYGDILSTLVFVGLVLVLATIGPIAISLRLMLLPLVR